VGKEQMDARHTIKPGLTGLAQIRGYRGETPDEASVKNRISSDLEYIKKQSLAMDGIIFIKSFKLLIESFTNKLFQKQTPNY
jgi:putative colanic acid biosynthesis UDP-glucose lipid carrier transferase